MVSLLFSDVQGGPHERRLLNDLLEHYNTLERPVYNESEPLQLLFGLTLQQIIDVVSFCSQGDTACFQLYILNLLFVFRASF